MRGTAGAVAIAALFLGAERQADVWDAQTINDDMAATANETTSCTPNDTYRLLFYETTAAVPRFNDSGTQVTVLVLQNPTDGAVAGTAYFWDMAGTLLAAPPFVLGARSTLVLNTSAVPGLAGQSGTITIGHDARYGDLAVKAVALEPAAGFSFDTPMGFRP